MTAQETNLFNAFETTLATTMGSSDTTLTVAAVTDSYPTTLSAPFYIVINPDSATNREVILVTAVNTGTKELTTSVPNRYLPGSASSSGLSHSSGQVVRMAPLQQHIEDINDRVDTIINEDGTEVNTSLFLDEDDMVSDSATKGVTQQSVKAYVDSQVTAQDLDFLGDSGSGAVDLDSQDFTIAGTANEIETSASGQTLTIGLPSTITTTLSATSVLSDGVVATTQSASDNSTKVATTAYVDAQLTAEDLDISADSGSNIAIDLDSEVLDLEGGTGIDTTTGTNKVTFAIDSTVATLSGSQALTNKTIDVDSNTVSNIEVDNLKSGVLDTDLSSTAGTDTTLPSAKAVKTYVDAQVTAQDLDLISDSGTIDIDLDSESLTVSGGEGIDTSATGTTLTIAGEDATTSNKGIASFSSDNFDVSSGAVTIKSGGVDLAAEVTGTLPVANGGTGATSLTDGGVLLGSGTGAVTATSVLTNGQLLIGDGTSDPTLATLTAGTNVSVTNGAGSITIAATDTNTTYTAGDGLDLSGTTFSTDLKSNGGLVIESTELAVDLGASSITGSLDAAKIADGSVSDAEFQRLDGVTSDIQTQLDGKQASGSYITASSTDTLTNKTFNVEGTGNSISNIDVADLKSGVLDTDLSSVSGSDDTLASAKAIKTYVDSTSSGITGYDAWYVTANVTASGDITTNLARQSGTLITKIGTGMTESSGVFTFPSTGIWKVSVKMQSVNIAGDTVLCFIVASDDNFSSDSNVGAAVFGNNSSTSATGGTGFGEVLLDIEDVSTDKVKFEAVSISSGSYITGGTYPDASVFTFVRIGDT